MTKNALRIIAFFILILISLAFGAQNYRTVSVKLNIDKTDTIIKLTNLEEVKNEFLNEGVLLKTDSDLNLNYSFNLTEPRTFRFSSLKPQTPSQFIYVSPGDDITYKLNIKNNLVFAGENAAHYNFYTKLFELKLFYPTYYKKQGISFFKRNCELNYQKRKLFLEEYSRIETVSPLFTQKINDILRFEYINWLFNRFMFSDNAIIDLEYLTQIDWSVFNEKKQWDNTYFYLALMNYLHFSSKLESKSSAYSREQLVFQLKLIDEKLVTGVKDYAIVKTIAEYEEHLKSENTSFLQQVIDEKLPEITEAKYKVTLQKIKHRLKKLELEFPKEVLASKLLDLTGGACTFEQILKQHGNKIKIIDFWASWCAPCIQEIKSSHEFRDKLVKEKQIEFIYFSIDQSSDKWKSKVISLEKSGMNKNQFLMSDSGLKNFFNVTTIPRYVILDHSNNVFMVNAPSPSDTLQFSELLRQIDSLKFR